MNDTENREKKKYWGGWPNSGHYMRDLLWAEKVSIKYLNAVANRPSKKKKCVIFDIDETLVFGDPEKALGVHEMELGVHNGQEIFILPRNEPIVRIARHAKKLGMVIVALTARPPESKLASITNMNYLDIPYDRLIMNEKDDDPHFKLKTRAQITGTYDITLTIGDQSTDCVLPGTNTAAIKLPCKYSKVSYAYIPPGVNL